jgi:two-component system sensor histidine kinase AlgZ
MNTITVHTAGSSAAIPDFCARRTLATIAATMEVLAVLITVSDMRGSAATDGRLLLVLSAYMQIAGLAGAAAMCSLRRLLGSANPLHVLALGCLAAVTLVALWSQLAWILNSHFQLWKPLADTCEAFVARTVIAGALVTLMLLSYLYQRQRWQERDERSEADSRYLALQARIRPHFLFNSLNSISSLIQTQPEKAEELVTDLADLFRASLDERTLLVPLSDEIELVKGYLRIEEARLGDKLLVNWEIPDELRGALIPRLTVQPLVENAIYHGISRLRARGLLHVTARREGDYLLVEVENPLPPEDVPTKKGTGVAVNNIAQRIKLIYGDRARLELGPDQNELGRVFRARLQVLYRQNSGESR